MKKVVLLLILFTASLQGLFAQDDGYAFWGHWTNHETNTGMVVYKDAFNHFQAIQWD